jgi:cell division protein FtsI/penicillin-binding protein 2
MQFAPSRAIIALLVIGLGLTALLARVAWLQTHGRERTLAQAQRQQHQSNALKARRGTIFDATGNVLAGTVQTRTVFVDPRFLLNAYQRDGRSLVAMDEALDRLAEMLGLDPFELATRISENQHRRYIAIAENVDDALADAVRDLRIPGVGMVPVNVRYYPMGALAGHVLGTIGRDDAGQWDRGLEGLELQFDATLAGQDGRKRAMRDARRRQIAVAEDDYTPPDHGRHLVLTLDAQIQMIVEEELDRTCREFRAKRGEVILMDPRTGDILAMANWPRFNPQNLEDSTPDMRRNRCLTDPYECGSVIKPFLIGPALAERLTRADEIWPVPGITYRTDYGRRITDVHHYGPLTTWDGLVKSSNIVSAMIAERMGQPKLHQALRSSGFGSRTGIELPGEDPGLVRPLRQWTRHSTHSVAQGYELLVTPLQMVRAMAIYANGGRLVQPRIVKGVLDADGTLIAQNQGAEIRMLPQVVDPVTAAEVKRILADVPVRGTGTRARSHTWNLFGKTGTAHVAVNGRYDEQTYTANFIGGAPAEDPRLVIVFIVHEPDRSISHFGGTVSAPGAMRILERTLAYLQVPASPQLPLPPEHIRPKLVNFNPNAYRQRTAAVQ